MNVSQSQVPVAAVKTRNHDISGTHVTTSGFMDFDVVCARELIPNTHLKDTHRCFLRTDPLDVPTLGSFKVHNRAFWVPFRVVFEPFTDFITNVPHNYNSSIGIVRNVPRLFGDVIFNFFVNYGSTTGSSSDFDFVSGSNYYVFNSFGRWAYKLLRSLGYNIFTPDSSGSTDISFSALPILCCAKIYCDYYYPSAYVNIEQSYVEVQSFFVRQSSYDLSDRDLFLFLDFIHKVSYENDFFTTVWDNPVGPSGSSVPNVSFSDITINSSIESQSSISTNGTPVLVGSGSTNLQVLTQYNLDSLKALTDYVKRHQLSGSSTLQRMLTSFGVALSAEKLKRCIYLGSDDFPVQIGDVMSTASTSDASLGSYAGKAVGYSEGHTFELDTDEFGYYIVVRSIIPDVSYVDGYDYNLRHISLQDFFTPEFDMLAVRMVERGEVAHSLQFQPGNSRQLALSEFGYAPYYSEYRKGRDILSGDFVVPSVSLGLQGWYTARMFKYSLGQQGQGLEGWLLRHNVDFMLGYDSDQYLRVFGISAADKGYVDPFKVVHSDNILISSPMKHLYDTYDFENEDNASNTVTVDNGGSRLN